MLFYCKVISLRPTHLPIQNVLGTKSPRKNRPRLGAENSPSSVAKAIISGAIVPVIYIIILYNVMITEDQWQFYFNKPRNMTNCSDGKGSSLRDVFKEEKPYLPLFQTVKTGLFSLLLKGIQLSNQLQPHRTLQKKLYYLARTKRDCTSALWDFKWNISFTDHKQHKKLPSSTENSSVSISGSALLHLARL